MRPFYLPGSYLVLELTNTCSLSCLHCSVSEDDHPHHQKHGFLQLELAEALFADLAATGARFDTLIPFWLGEPLLHPRFAEFYRAALRTAVQHGSFGKVEVHSNATHLSERLIATVLNRANIPQVWHFSLDAASPETYKKVKGPPRYEKVLSNVQAFLREKARKNARWPRPVFQFIVSDRNALEAEKFRDDWKRECEKLGIPVRVAAQAVPGGEEAVVFFRQLDCPTAAEQSRQNEVFLRTMERLGLATKEEKLGKVSADNQGICSCFWKSPVVSYDGQLTICTRDNRQENKIGSLHERGFSSIWWGEEMGRNRAQVARADYSGLPPCKNCFIPKSSNYSDISSAEIRALLP